MIKISISLALFSIFIILSLLHFSWGMGRKEGRGDLLEIKMVSWILEYGLLIVAFIFTVRALGDFKYVGLFKKIKNTTFARMDTRYYSPLCLVISALCIILEYLN